jgi:hypothetical protein
LRPGRAYLIVPFNSQTKEKDIRFSVKNCALSGILTGATVATVLLPLSFARPFSAAANGFLERLAFQLCPLFILGFGLKSWIWLFAFVFLGNALLYGLAFGLLGFLARSFYDFCKPVSRY